MMPILERFAELRPQAFFVQIGSHDGQQQDPLRTIVLSHEWSGIMVEPVPYVFARLKRHYGHLTRLTLENVAVGPEDGSRSFYHLRDTTDAGRPGLPIWFDALGTLDRDVLLAHRRFIPDIEERVVEIQVPCVTFDSLARRNGVERIDVLHTDTEGSDLEILRSVPFDRFRPTLVVFESVHLPPPAREVAADLMQQVDYECFEYGLDIWCFNRSTLPKREADDMGGLWRWLTDPARGETQLLATRALRSGARRMLRRDGETDPLLRQLLELRADERRYLVNGYDDRTPLPAGAESALDPESPRLRELAERYGRLDTPARTHHMWRPEKVTENLELRYFRGDNVYVWHYRQHPRTMALKLFARMQHLEGRGGGQLLSQLSEDGAFGAWTVDAPGRGTLSRDRLDSAGEILFLERHLGVLGHPQLRILDVGAGYGRLAHRMAEAHGSLGDYCCVDAVPESTFLSEYYLGFRGVMPPARVLALDEVSGLSSGSFDLAINVHSFSECTMAAIEWWLSQLRRLEVPNLFIVPNEASGIRSREPDGRARDVMPSLTAAGYHQVAMEPALDDPALQELVENYDNHYLFALG